MEHTECGAPYAVVRTLSAVLTAAFWSVLNVCAADVRVWTGLGGNTLWGNETNWFGRAVPSRGDSVLIDGDGSIDSEVLFELKGGTNVVLDSISVSSGDKLSLRPVSQSSASCSVTNHVSNAGVMYLGGARTSSSHGRNFNMTLVVKEGSVFNGEGGEVFFDSYTSYRRSTSKYRLTASVKNNGNISVRNRSSEGGGKVCVGLDGDGVCEFENNGIISLEGRGNLGGTGMIGNNTWAVMGPETGVSLLKLSGTGELRLQSSLGTDKSSYAILTGVGKNTSLENGPDHTISGCGYLGVYMSQGRSGNTMTVNSFSSIVNKGFIKAECSDKLSSLCVGASGGVITNAAGGRMASSGGAGTVLKIGSDSASGLFFNAGVLEARTGTTVCFASNVVSRLDGTIRGGGAFSGASDIVFSSARIMPGDSENEDCTGESTVGVMSIDGNAAFSEDTILSVDFYGSTEGVTVHDAVNVSGSLTLDGIIEADCVGRVQEGVPYPIITCAPGMLSDAGISVRAPSGSACPLIAADVDTGVVSLIFPKRETLITVF